MAKAKQEYTAAAALAGARQQYAADPESPAGSLIERAEHGSSEAEAEIRRRHETSMFVSRFSGRLARIADARRDIVASVAAGLIPRAEVEWLTERSPMVGELDERGDLVGGLSVEVLDAEIRALEATLRGRRT